MSRSLKVQVFGYRSIHHPHVRRVMEVVLTGAAVDQKSGEGIGEAEGVQRQIIIAAAATYLGIDATPADRGEVHLSGDAVGAGMPFAFGSGSWFRGQPQGLTGRLVTWLS